MDVYRRLIGYYWPYRRIGIGALLCVTLAAAIGVARPLLLKILIDQVIVGKQYNQLYVLTAAVLGAAILRAIFQFGRGYLGHVFGANAVHELRVALYNKLQRLSFSYYDRARTGDLMSRLAGDVEVFRQFLAFGLFNLVDFFLMFGFGLAAMALMNWQLTLLILVTMPVLTVTAIRFQQKVHDAYSEVRRAAADINTAVQENLSGMRAVKSFAREPQQAAIFGERNREYARLGVYTAGIWAKYFPAMELLGNVSVLLLFWFGGLQVIHQQLTVGGFVAFFGLIWYVVGPVQWLGAHLNVLTQSLAAGERVLEILDTREEIKSDPKAIRPRKIDGDVLFDQVSFTYPGGTQALCGIDLRISAGTTVGILGAAGTGKSSLAALLFRAYDPTVGRIMVDGVDLRKYAVDSIREQIGVVFQETFLFSATIRDNIRYSKREASEAEIEWAARLAHAHDFIMELPAGYDTVVGERGMGLSGGQKQRVAIARALLSDPGILILDDATASVDTETERDIQQALLEVTKGRTTIIIAHRISSLRHADQILVLDKGRIVEQGTHEELISRGGRYAWTDRAQHQDVG